MRLHRVALSLVMLVAATAAAQEIPNAPAVPQGGFDAAWPGYFVVPWRAGTPELNDATAAAWKRDGIATLHLDKNFSPDEIAWADKHGFSLYLDHVAGKGILYLRERKELISRRPDKKWLVGPGLLLARPRCLHDPAVIAEMDGLVRRHVAGAKDHRPFCYSLDDEISTGDFVSASETCWAPASRPAFRKFAMGLYGGSLERLNAEWGTSFKSADEIVPEDADRSWQQARTTTADKWNFSRWADFRQFMDQTMADTLVHIVKVANEVDPKRPAGIEGSQQPCAYGGYDWSRLVRSVQWIENYDIGGNEEIIRSLAPRVIRAKTFFSRQSKVGDSAILWYHFAHGNRGSILWPSGKDLRFWAPDGTLDKRIAYLPPIFREMQGPRLATLLTGAEYQDDGVAIYYSQPSIRAAWILDSTVHENHGWAARSGGIERYNSTSILCRLAWMAMLQDAGLQYSFIDAPKLAAGELTADRFKVLILPACFALSDAEIAAMEKFVKAGGTVIADFLPGLMNEHCRFRTGPGIAQSLFGVDESDLSAGLFDGKAVTFIDSEKLNKPLSDRFVTEGTQMVNGWPRVVRKAVTGNVHECFETQRSNGNGAPGGRTLLLNLSPVPYLVNRAAGRADPNAGWIGQYLKEARAAAPVTVRTAGRFNEVVRWRKGDKEIICVVKSPPRQLNESFDAMAKLGAIDDRPTRLTLEWLARPAGPVVNVRTGKTLDVDEGEDGVFRLDDTWIPCEAAIYEHPSK
ncbi:MAG: hypothetical protein BIFFINMI_03074 [Phycisphaerae bacterium]|nr:hypothetical protein [Phycisphaerae bacterium]